MSDFTIGRDTPPNIPKQPPESTLSTLSTSQLPPIAPWPAWIDGRRVEVYGDIDIYFDIPG
jgi:hypothetical protein